VKPKSILCNVSAAIDIVSALGHAADSLNAQEEKSPSGETARVVHNTPADADLGDETPRVRSPKAFTEG
jgi:hypothetical protein